MTHNENPITRRSRQAAHRLSLLAATLWLASCGGGGGGTGATPTPPPPPPPPPAVEFEVVAGAAACGSSCDVDNAGGDGVGSGDSGDGGDGAGGGLGEMRNVTVIARKPDGTVLGQAALTDNLVSLYPRSYTGAFILEFKDAGNGEYFDEARGAWVPLGGTSLHVLVPELSHHVSANPLTEAAYRYAVAKYGSESALTAARMTEANDLVRDAFNARTPAAYRVSDVTNYAAAVGPATAAGTLKNTHAGRYATLLAAMAKAALTYNPALATGQPALEFTRQVGADVVDDGAVNASNAAADQKAYDATVPVALSSAVETSRAQYGDSSQPVPVSAPTTCFNPALYTVGATWSLSYATTGSSFGDESTTYRMNSPTTFNGVPDLLELEAHTAFDDGSSITILFYYDQDLSAGIRFYGDVATSRDIRTESTYSPAAVDRRFLLSSGQTDTSSYVSTVRSFDSVGAPIGDPQVSNVTVTRTFSGLEDVTAQGVTYRNACRFDVQGSFGSSTEWITSSGQGVSIKSVTRDAQGTVTFTSELKSGTVNGEPVR